MTITAKIERKIKGYAGKLAVIAVEIDGVYVGDLDVPDAKVDALIERLTGNAKAPAALAALRTEEQDESGKTD